MTEDETLRSQPAPAAITVPRRLCDLPSAAVRRSITMVTEIVSVSNHRDETLRTISFLISPVSNRKLAYKASFVVCQK